MVFANIVVAVICGIVAALLACILYEKVMEIQEERQRRKLIKKLGLDKYE